MKRSHSSTRSIPIDLTKYSHPEESFKKILRLKANHKCLIEDQLEVLRKEAEKMSENVHQLQGSTTTHEIIELIFNICEQLKVETSIKYYTIDLYETFCINFNDYIIQATREMTESQVNQIIERLKSQILLRICSCIQLASKMFSTTNLGLVSCEDLRNVLWGRNRSFNLAAIARSEGRVWKFLSHKISRVTSFDLIEHMIVLVDIDQNLIERVYIASMLFLDLMYLQHTKIYSDLHTEMKTTNPTMSQSTFRKFQFNKNFQAAAVVAASLFKMLHYEDNKLYKRLSELSNVSEKNILNLSAILINTLQTITRKSTQDKITPVESSIPPLINIE